MFLGTFSFRTLVAFLRCRGPSLTYLGYVVHMELFCGGFLEGVADGILVDLSTAYHGVLVIRWLVMEMPYYSYQEDIPKEGRCHIPGSEDRRVRHWGLSFDFA